MTLHQRQQLPDTYIKHCIHLENWPCYLPYLSLIEKHCANSRLCRPRASVTASIEAPFARSTDMNLFFNTAKFYQNDACQTKSSH